MILAETSGESGLIDNHARRRHLRWGNPGPGRRCNRRAGCVRNASGV